MRRQQVIAALQLLQIKLLIEIGRHQQHHIALLHRALPVMPMVEAAQQRRAKGFAVVAGPLVDDQPAAGIELLLTVFQKAPGQMAGGRTMVGIEVDKQQIGLLRTFQQLQGVANADGQARVIGQAHMLHGQTRHVGAQLDHLDIIQGQKLQAGLGQIAGTQAQKQRAFRLFVAQRAQQHGAGVVVLQPAGVGHIDAALLDRLAKFEKAISTHFHHLNQTEFILYFGDQKRLGHLSRRR